MNLNYVLYTTEIDRSQLKS